MPMAEPRHSLNARLILLACLLTMFIHAVGATAFAAQGVSLDNSLGQTPGSIGPGTVDGTTTTYLITDTLGNAAGSNLFYSFGSFNIRTGESATFTSPGNSSYANIIGRVTGGSPSSIDGALRSTIEGADIYLLNPYGVMFGPDASLDIKAGLHISTADYLRFADGAVFNANPTADSVLSVAAPEAFGFLGANPAGISADRSYLEVPEGATLSFVGGDIDYQGDVMAPANLVIAPSGRINLVSVASPGEVDLNSPDMGINSFARLGNISFSNFAYLSVEGGDPYTQPAGTVVIRGGQLVLTDGGVDAGGDPGGQIDVKGGSLELNNFYFYTTSFGEADHPGTACLIELQGDFLMQNASWMESSSWDAGNAGDILIRAANMQLGNDTPGQGYAEFYPSFYGHIISESYFTGSGGNIHTTASGDMTVQNGFYVVTLTYDQAAAGDLVVQADRLRCLNQGNIGTVAYGAGQGGKVQVIAREILICAADHAAIQNSMITGLGAQALDEAEGGKLTIRTDTLRLLDGGRIVTALWGSGQGADVEVTAKEILISGYAVDATRDPAYMLSGIDARVYGSLASGSGGDINVSADRLGIADHGVIRTGLYADSNGSPSGTAGSISISAGAVEIASRGQIYADSFRGTGDSGDIDITAGSMRIAGTGGSTSPSPLGIEFTGLSTTTSVGRGGAIHLAVSGDLSLSEGGGIRADTQDSGSGGAIDIQAANISLTGSALITAESKGAGNAGNIGITVADTFAARNSAVSTEAAVADGGNIRIDANRMVHLVDSTISTSVGGGAATVGGNITIDPDFVILKNSRITANAYEGAGGNIRIDAGIFLEDPGSTVDASSALGINGTVDIRALITNISGVITPLPKNFVSAEKLLKEPCEVRARGGQISSFVIRGREGLPIEPGNFMPSPPP
jgi:filamentous hemagglutinin family protein